LATAVNTAAKRCGHAALERRHCTGYSVTNDKTGNSHEQCGRAVGSLGKLDNSVFHLVPFWPQRCNATVAQLEYSNTCFHILFGFQISSFFVNILFF